MYEKIIENAQNELKDRILKKYLEPFVDLIFMPNDPKKSLQMVISESLRELKAERAVRNASKKKAEVDIGQPYRIQVDFQADRIIPGLDEALAKCIREYGGEVNNISLEETCR